MCRQYDPRIPDGRSLRCPALMVCYPRLGPLERSEIRLFWTDSPWRIGRFQEVHRHPIADGSMGSDMIVVLPPIVDLHCGVLQVWEPSVD